MDPANSALAVSTTRKHNLPATVLTLNTDTAEYWHGSYRPGKYTQQSNNPISKMQYSELVRYSFTFTCLCGTNQEGSDDRTGLVSMRMRPDRSLSHTSEMMILLLHSCARHRSAMDDWSSSMPCNCSHVCSDFICFFFLVPPCVSAALPLWRFGPRPNLHHPGSVLIRRVKKFVDCFRPRYLMLQYIEQF